MNHYAKIAKACRFTQLALPIGGAPVDFAPRLAYGWKVRKRERQGWQTVKVTRRRAVAERVYLGRLADGENVKLGK